MGNTIGLTVHGDRADKSDSRSHVLDWELSMMAWFAGCSSPAIPTATGQMRWRFNGKSPVGPHAGATG
jgi:threonine aldolase